MLFTILAPKSNLLNRLSILIQNPYSPKPNFYWSRILNAIFKINISSNDFEILSFKFLYLLILNPDSILIPSLPDLLSTKSTPSSHTWLRLFLLKPRCSFLMPRKNRFQDSLQRLYLGPFLSKTFNPSLLPNYFLSKLCSSSTDDPHHLFF